MTRNTARRRKEFTGIHGETFSIRTGWHLEKTACNIASVLLADTEKETVLTKTALRCARTRSRADKGAALKIKAYNRRQATSKNASPLIPTINWIFKQFSFCASTMYSHAYKESRPKFLADPKSTPPSRYLQIPQTVPKVCYTRE